MAQTTLTRVAGAASATTGAFTSVTGRTYFAVCRNGLASAAPTSVTSTNGIIFRRVASQTATGMTLTLWVGVCTSGASGTATSSYGSSSNPSINVLEAPAGSWVKNFITTTGTGTAITGDLTSVSSESAVALVLSFANNTTRTFTPESGYASLSLSNNNDAYGMVSDNDGDATPLVNINTSATWVAISFEVGELWGTGSISYVGSGTGTGTATLPSHQVGDLVLVFAYRDGNTTAPTLPTGATSSVNVVNGSGNTNSARVGRFIAATTSETIGTWTNARSVIAHVYRNVAVSTPIGGSATATGASTTVSYPALTMADSSGSSWVAGFAGHRSVNTTLENAPTGMTNRSTVVDATDEAAGHDTNGGVTSWTLQTSSVGGTSSGWMGQTVEIRAGITEPAVSLSGQTAITITGTTLTPRVTTNKNSGTLYYVVVANGDSPSVAQIKAGQNSLGSAAIFASNSTVSRSGVTTMTTATGLTPLTDYDVWFVHTYNSTDSTAVKADVTTTSNASPVTLFWAFP